MIPTTITLTLDHQTLEAINRLISALEKANLAPAVPTQPMDPVPAKSETPIASTAPVALSAPVATPVANTAPAPVQPRHLSTHLI